MDICPSTALAVAIVIVIVAADELVNVFNLDVIGTVPALDVTVTAVLVQLNCASVPVPERDVPDEA
jgi:hypothetical protein